MYDLFNPAPDYNLLQNVSNSWNTNEIFTIPGLIYIPKFIDVVEQDNLLNSINLENWLSDLKRRVQHYGYKYDYKSKKIDKTMFIGNLPPWANNIANRLLLEKFIGELPDQVIVNEYEPGQGIANHVDCEPCFGDTIISISLGSFCVMDLINLETKQKVEILLEPGSLIALTGDARYKWSHGIAQRKTDNFMGSKIDRKLRISLTFRKVILK